MKKPMYYILAAYAILQSVVIFTKYHLPDWDETVYIAMGRHIYSGGQLGLFEPIRPLGLPLMLPFGSVVSAQLVMLAFSLGVIAATYLITEKVFSKKAAVLSTAIMGLVPLFFVFTGSIYTGIPTTFFCLLALYYYLRKNPYMAGLFSGIAFLFRFPSGLVLAALCITALLEKRGLKHCVKIASSFIVTILPFVVFAQLAYGGFIETMLSASLHQNNRFFGIEGFWQNLLYYPYILTYTSFVLAAFLFSRPSKKAMALYITGGLFLLYFTAITNKQPRFGLMILPFLAIFAGDGITRLYNMCRRIRLARYGIAALFIFGLIVMAAQDYRYYAKLPKDEPAFVDDYYRYPYEGLVLTTDPGPAAYSDAKFVPAYGDVFIAYELLSDHLADGTNTMFILYPAVLPCYDKDCEHKYNLIVDRILADNYELVYTYDNYDYSRYVYRITNKN